MFEGLLQPTHLILILTIALIVVGPGKIGDLGGQLGKSVREFRHMADGTGTEPAGIAAGGRYCTACGTRLDSAATFCSACGAKSTT